MNRTLALALAAAALLLAPFASAQRVLSLAGDATEIVFALGAEDKLVAVDATSNYPAAAAELPNVGYPGRLSAEALMAFEPTHVIANDQAGPAEVLDQLAAAGVEIVRLGSALSLDTPVDNVRLISGLLGEEERGEALVAEYTASLTAAKERAAELASQPRVVFLYLGSRTMQFAGGAETSSNVMIEAAGGINVGAELGFVGNVPYTPEAIVTGAPEVIIVTERGINVVGSVDAVRELPGVSETPAARAGNVIVFEDGYFLNLGLRTGDALMELVEYLHSLQ